MWDAHNVMFNPNNLLNYQRATENTSNYGFSHASNFVSPLFQVQNDQEVSEKMAENQIDSWLLSNHDHNDQVDHRSLNLGSYGACGPNDQCQCQCQFNPMQAQGFQTSSSYLSMVPGIVSDATSGTMDLPREWTLNQLPFSPFYPGNEVKEEIGTFTNSTSSYISSSLGTQQQVSQDYLQKPSNPPPMSRQDRLQRYFDKKKTRKYETKVIYSSRKTYAQTRPRIRGRFARSSQTDASEK